MSIWLLSADDYKAKLSLVSFLGRASSKGTTNRRGRMFHDESALDTSNKKSNLSCRYLGCCCRSSGSPFFRQRINGLEDPPPDARQWKTMRPPGVTSPSVGSRRKWRDSSSELNYINFLCLQKIPFVDSTQMSLTRGCLGKKLWHCFEDLFLGTARIFVLHLLDG